MKKTIYTYIILLGIIGGLNIPAFSQTENVGIGTTSPDNSALLHLDVSSMTTKRGLLIPKMTTAQRNGISNPANGLIVYLTDDNTFYYNAGTPGSPNWVAIVSTNTVIPFDKISSGTNTTATMQVGNGASLFPTGTGYIQSNRFVGNGSVSDAVDLATNETNGILPITKGGTNLSTTPTDGQLLIGNTTTSSYTLGNLTAGTGITINNGAGNITISTNATAIDHNALNNLQIAGNGVTYGHINDQAQTIAGTKTFSNNVIAPSYTSTVTTGTAPFFVNSSTKVDNLNADLLDGLNSSDFLQLTNRGDLTTTTSGITITGGTNAVIGTGTSINIAIANGTTTGLLSSTDWNTFNNKENALTFNTPLSRTVNTISIPQANGTTDGYLSSTDWNTFNNKENAITKGDLTTTTSGVTITGGTNAVIGTGTSINIATANGTTTGLLSSTDWTNFNNKENALTFNTPLSRTVNTISIPQANGTTDGYLSSTDWNTFNNKENAITKGDLTTTTSGVTITGGTNAVIGTGTSINIATANGTTTGLLSSTDWTNFNNKENALTFNTPLSRTVNTISIPQANGTTDGYLSSTDWNTFNNKIGTGTVAGGDLSGTYPNPSVAKLQGYSVSSTAPNNGEVLKWNGTNWTPSTDNAATYTAGNGIDITGTTISVLFAGSGSANTASRSDHNHNGIYEPVLTKGDLTTTTSGITITGGTNAVIGTGTSINIATANGTTTGLLSSTDWTNFNNKENALTFNTPLSRTVNTISIPQANGTTDGYLSSTDWNTFNNKIGTGTVAGGDLSGTYPNPSVVKLQGFNVSNTTPTNGQVLTWNNTLSQWEPQSPGGSTGWALTGNNLTGTEFLGSTNNQPLVISTNNTERMRVLGSGKIGIGLNNPQTLLHQDEGNSIATYHKFTAGTTTGQTLTDGFDVGIDTSGNAILKQNENLNMQFYTNSTERMRLQGDGKLLIGTTTNPDDSVLVRVNGDVWIEKDLIVTGTIDPEAIVLQPRTTPPGTPVEGMIYYDKNNKSLNVNDGTNWNNINTAPVLVKATMTSDVSFPDSPNLITVKYDSTSFDNYNAFNTSTYRFVAPKDGIYRIDGKIVVDDKGNPYFLIAYIFINGVQSSLLFSEMLHNLQAYNYYINGFPYNEVIQLNKDDYLEIKVRQNWANPNVKILGGKYNTTIVIQQIQ